ncbi:MAG TPA: PEP-CTERM sorting domain-containing protein [Nitrospira sp.]|nr:PEP-CTERM sorting domain-containing protein [Nitrospira sp.]
MLFVGVLKFLTTGGKMKPYIYALLIVLFTLLSLPATSDAFSRRSSSSEVSQSQVVTTPHKKPHKNNTLLSSDVSAQAVPEPPVLVLMSIGLGVLALGYAIRSFRKQA